MDLYKVLELEKTATKDEIKKAYRKKAMKYHPDRNAGDKESEKKFKEVNEAYSTLSDDSKRQQYDMFGKSGWAAGGSPFGGGFGGWWTVDVDLWDIFDSFFGGWFWGSWAKRTTFKGEDLEQLLNIDLKTSIYWGKEKIKFKKKETCVKCEWAWGKWKTTCNKCNGKWKVTYTQNSMFWTIQQTWVCNDCSGSWESFSEMCSSCKWEKRKVINKEKEIDIPAGIDNWMIIKMSGEANHWVWTKAHWDLYIKFSVKLEDKWLKRDWTNLYYDLEIDLLEAVLWTKKEINIPIIWKRTIDIKAGTQSETILKIKWDWVKKINNESKWDLFIKLIIKIPKKLSKKERNLYEEIAKEKKINVNSWGVFKKLFK